MSTEIGTLIVPVVSTDPSVVAPGMLWFNSTANVFRYVDNTNAVNTFINATQPNANHVLNGDFRINNDPVNNVVQNGQTNKYWNDVWLLTTGTGGSAKCACTTDTTALATNDGVSPRARAYALFTQSTGGSTNPALSTRLENIRTLSGRTVTLSFYAKAGANLTLPTLKLTQNYGTGGSPTSSVVTTIASNVAVTTSWAVYQYTFAIPSIAGGTEGTNNNSYLQLDFNFPTGTTFTFSLANVKLELGSARSPYNDAAFEVAAQRVAVARLYQSLSVSVQGYSPLVAGTFGTTVPFITPMRATPTATIQSTGTTTNAASGSPSVTIYNNNAGMLAVVAAAAGTVAALNNLITLDARL